MIRRIFGRPASSLKVPLPNTYWVEPGRLLAGEHPYGADDADTRERLELMREAGIDCFIDLTHANETQGYRRWLPAQTKYLNCPIRDVDVPDAVVLMHHIQKNIRSALKFGRHVYVHCRAGIGRTGIVIGCYLVEKGLTGEAALKELNVLWRQSARSKSWPTVPQTPQQAAYIQHWPQHRSTAKPKTTPYSPSN